MNKVNRIRKAALREKQYGLSFGYASWICSFPCVVPDCKRDESYTVPAHAKKTRGAGGTWKDMVPLCWIHENDWHARGTLSFDRHYGTDLKQVARDLVATWESDHKPRTQMDA